MHHPIGIAPIFEARGQAFGDLERLLDRRQQQYAAVRGQPAAVEPDKYRLARDRWQTGQNPRTFLRGGRELRWRRLIRPQQPNYPPIRRAYVAPASPFTQLAELWGSRRG